jgi:hypothetical protein
MLTSYIFRPKISIYNRKVAIDFTFISPLYRGRVNINYRVFITDLILAVVALLERDINRLVVEARETLELVKL